MDETVARRKTGVAVLVFTSFLLVGIIPLVIVSYVSTEASKRVQEQSVIDKLLAVSGRQFDLIEDFGREKLKNLESISTMPFVVEFAEAIADQETNVIALSDYVQWRSLMEKFRGLYGFHDILIINLEGDIVFSLVEEKDRGTNLLVGPYKETALAEVYKRARNNAEVRVSDYRYYAPSEIPAIFIARRILKETEHSRPVAVIAIQLTGVEINQVVSSYFSLGQTGETVLGKKEQDRFVFINNLRHVPDAAFTKAGKMGEAQAIPMQQALLQESGSGLSSDYRGEKVLAAWRYLPLWRWGMVVKVDVEEAYEEIVDYQYFVLVITLIGLGAILALAAFVSRVTTKPLRELVAVTAEIAEGNLDIRAPKLGIAELSNLSESFNKMAINFAEMIQSRDTELSAKMKTQSQLDIYAKNLASVNTEMVSKIDRLDKSRKAMFYMIDDLNRVSNSLKIVNKELEAFSYSVSHDLRAPLRAMDGFSNALLEDYADELDDEGKGFLDRICVASQKMSQLIDDLLGLSRITRQDLNVHLIDLGQLASTVIEDLRQREPDRQVKITIQKNLEVFGDKDLTKILLENLLGNAWKFTGNKNPAEISVGTMKIKGNNTFFVRDNGSGFDMTYVSKIFDAFQRLHSTDEFAGSGIGLAIVQRIINRHGGTVWAESKLHEGTTFFFTFG